jgi:hypothetical protein
MKRAGAALTHLILSAVVAGLAAVLVLALWYPYPFRQVAGGRELFLLLVGVDVILGPLITFAVFDPRKARVQLVRDLAVVVAIQVAALIYGLHVSARARPAVVALEGNRLRVVRAIDLDSADLASAPEGLRTLSLTGPRFLATRRPSEAERLEAIQLGLAGQDIGMRPAFWLPEPLAAPAFASAALPIDRLFTRHPQRADEIRAALAAIAPNRSRADALGYLPILGRRSDWSAVVDRISGSIVGYVPIDGF